jgi:hypothetical protein
MVWPVLPHPQRWEMQSLVLPSYNAVRVLNFLAMVPLLGAARDVIDLLIPGSQSDQLDIAFVSIRVLDGRRG